MRDILQSNVLGLYFVYGLSFYTMGLAIAMQYRSYSTFRLAYSLSFLAAFGVLHGLSEWGSIFVPIQVPDLGQESMWKMMALQKLLQASSYFFLFAFGAKLTGDTWGRGSWWLPLPAGVFLVWMVFYARFIPLIGTPDLMAWLQLSEVWSRYLLALPGGILAGLALALQTRDMKVVENGSLVANLWGAAGAFIVYAVVGGLIVSPATFFPASLINTTMVQKVTGLPVELFRTLVGFVVTFCMTRILAVFDLERQKRLDESHRKQGILLERQRLSRELHDGVLQSIYGIGVSLQTSGQILNANPEEAGKRLAGSVQRLNDVIQSTRNYINELQPAAAGIGLKQMMRTVIEEFQEDHGLLVDFYCDRLVPDDSWQSRQGELVALLKEALHNVAKHARASAVRVNLAVEGRYLVLTIRDNGVGFTLPQAEKWRDSGKPGHHGLKNMHARARALGGTLSIKSVRGEGTEVTVVLLRDSRGQDAKKNGTKPGHSPDKTRTNVLCD